MSFRYNPSSDDFELTPDSFSDRNSLCPCERDKQDILKKFKELLAQTDAGRLTVEAFAYHVTGTLSPYGTKMVKKDPWYENVFSISGPLEVCEGATKEHPDYLKLKQFIMKGSCD